jgi:acetyl esterase/lipase
LSLRRREFLAAAAAVAATSCRPSPRARNVRYSDYPETVLDVWCPEGAGTQLFPAVVVFHGGGWYMGAKERVVVTLCAPYLQRGFAVVNVGYRLAPRFPAPAALDDALSAVRWLRGNAPRFEIDPRRVAACGHSAGGHLALMTALAPGSDGLVRAVVNLAGVTDIAAMLDGPDAADYARIWVPPQVGRVELARRVSPLWNVRAGIAPILTVHGESDEIVPFSQAVRLTEALRAAGNDATLIPIPGGGHSFSAPGWNGAGPRVFDFLARRLS